MRDRAVGWTRKFSEALAPRRSRDAGAVARVGAGAPENVEKVHSEIVSGARYAGGVCRGRAPAPEAPRRPREIAVCRRQLPGPEKRGRARARVARRTRTLDALRAATEPVKVEAIGHFCVVKGCGVWCVCEWLLRSRRTDVCWYAAILPTRRFLPAPKSLSSIWRSSHVFPAKTLLRVEQTSCQLTTKSRLTKRRFERFPSGEAESHLERIKIDIAFSLSNAR